MADSLTREMVWLECGECGAAFGMSKQFNEQRRVDGKSFYCINGHSRAYVKSSLEKANETIAEKERALATLRDRLLSAENESRVARDKAARFKCPHCTRDYATRAGVLKHEREAHRSPLRLTKDAGPDALNSKVS